MEAELDCLGAENGVALGDVEAELEGVGEHARVAEAGDAADVDAVAGCDGAGARTGGGGDVVAEGEF